MERSDLRELRQRVSQVIYGEAKPNEVRLAVLKQIREARARQDVDGEVELRLMMGSLEYFGPHRERSDWHYLSVLRKRSNSVQAMEGMAAHAASQNDTASARRWLESAVESAEREGDITWLLSALDHMIWLLHADADDASRIFAREREVLEAANGRVYPPTGGAEWLLLKGRGPEVLDYLEYLPRWLLTRRSSRGPLMGVLLPLIGAYSQCGLSLREARSKIEELRELCVDEDTRSALDHAIERSFARMQRSPTPEMYGVRPGWVDEDVPGV